MDDGDDGGQLGGEKHLAARKGRPEKKDIWKLSKFSWKDGWHGVAGSNLNQEKCNIPSATVWHAPIYFPTTTWNTRNLIETGLLFSA